MFEIGSSLREARLRKGLDYPAVAEATKIRAKHLEALEDEQFELLPGQTYVRGFLKTYADYLGLDGRLYVDEYNSRFWIEEDGGHQSPRRVRMRRKHHGRIERNMIGFTLVAIAGVTALVIAAWNFGGGTSAATTTPQPVLPSHRQTANLVVRAVGGSSVVDVRRGSTSGRQLFHGTLEHGESQVFVAKRLWIAVSAPRHVELTLNQGSPVRLGGKCPRAVAVTAQQITSTASCR